MKWEKKNILHFFLSFLMLLLLFLGVLADENKCFTVPPEAISFSEAWTIVKTGKELQLPYDMAEDLHIRKTLPEVSKRMVILLHCNYQSAVVKVDGEVIQENGPATLGAFHTTAGNYMIQISMDPAYSGKEIDIYIQRMHTLQNFQLKSIFLTNYEKLGYYTAVQKWSSSIIGGILLMLFFAGMLCFFTFYRSRDILGTTRIKALAYVSFVALVLGLWVLTESQFTGIAMGRFTMSGSISHMMVLAAPLAAAMLLSSFANTEISSLDHLVVTAEALLTLSLMLILFGVADYYFLIPFARGQLVLVLCTGGFLLVKNFDKTLLANRKILISTALLLFSCMVSVVFSHNRTNVIVHCSIFSAIGLGLFLFNRVIRLNRRISSFADKRIASHYAMIDELTGFGNRAAFATEMQLFEKETNCACIMMDVDNLKVCNDNYGHLAGDLLLKEAGQCIARVFGGEGFPAFRVGGDEFVVLIKEITAEEIRLKLGALQREIAELNEKRKLKEALPLDISAGYAIRRDSNETMEQLYSRSDIDMYRSKQEKNSSYQKFRVDRISSYLKLIHAMNKSTDVHLFVMDLESGEIWIEGNICSFFRVRSSNFRIESFVDLEGTVDINDLEVLQNTYQALQERSIESFDIRFRMLTTGGEMTWVSCVGKAMNNLYNVPFALIGRIVDLGKQNQANPTTGVPNANKLVVDVHRAGRSGHVLFLKPITKDGDQQTARLIQAAVMDVKKANPYLENIYYFDGMFALLLSAKNSYNVEKIFTDFRDRLKPICSLSGAMIPAAVDLFHSTEVFQYFAPFFSEKLMQQKGELCPWFSERYLENNLENYVLVSELLENITADFQGFSLVYQPQIRSGDFSLCGVECLLRYQSQVFGSIEPSALVPILEATGLIRTVGNWVLKEAVQQCAQWREAFPRLKMSVNFSQTQFEDGCIFTRIMDQLNQFRLPGEALELELTEIAPVGMVKLQEISREMGRNGIAVSIDDYGVGYMNLQYIMNSGIRHIKIDKSYVHNIGENPLILDFLKRTNQIARENGIQICYEGVETMEDALELERNFVGVYQGYYFHKPYSPAQFEDCFLRHTGANYEAFQRAIAALNRAKEGFLQKK